MMKAARIIKPKESLEIRELEVPKPRGSQVLIKVQSSGVCHSDVHVWEGYYEGIGGQPLKTTDRGVKYPLTPGHEIAGIVDSLAEQVEGFSKNEKVLVYPWIGEGICPACRYLQRWRLCRICIGTKLQVSSENRRRYGYRYKCAFIVCWTYSVWCSKKC
jgi:D-arabinose 1-dehydrogenase-like Zn-dependent alcohol dehydrogenase